MVFAVFWFEYLQQSYTIFLFGFLIENSPAKKCTALAPKGDHFHKFPTESYFHTFIEHSSRFYVKYEITSPLSESICQCKDPNDLNISTNQFFCWKIANHSFSNYFFFFFFCPSRPYQFMIEHKQCHAHQSR